MSHSAPERPSFLPRVRLSFFKRSRILQEHRRVPVLDVPFAPGRLRHANAEGVRMMKEKEKKKKKGEDEGEEEGEDEDEKAKLAKTAKHAKNAATTSQPPIQSNITHRSAGPSQANSSSEPQAAVFASPTTPVDATPSAATTSSAPDATPLRVRCCTPFLLCIGRASAVRHPDGRH